MTTAEATNPGNDGTAIDRKELKRHAAILAVPLLMFLYSVGALYRDFRAELSAEGEGAPVAAVNVASGDVKRRPPMRFRWFQAGKESSLYRGDSLRTAEGAGTTIGFEDGGELEVGESSLIVLERTPAGKLNIQLGGGKLRYKAGKNSKANVQIQVGDRKFSAAGAGSDASFSRKQGITTVDVSEGTVAQVGVKDAKPITKSDWLKVDALGQAETLSKPAVLIEPKAEASFIVQSEKSTGVRLKFKWKPVREGERVRLEVSSSPDFKAIVQAVDVQGSEHQLALPPGQFHWRIRGVGKAATAVTEANPLMIARSEGVAPLSPAAGENVAIEKEGGKVLFSWKAPTYFQHFRLQVSRDADFTDLVVNEEVVGSRVLMPFEKAGNYHWRIEGISDSLKLTQASKPQGFKVSRPVEIEAPKAAPIEVAKAPALPTAPTAPVAAPVAAAPAPAAKAPEPEQAAVVTKFQSKLSSPAAEANLKVPTGSPQAFAKTDLVFETTPPQKQARLRIWKVGTSDASTPVVNTVVDLHKGKGSFAWKAEAPGRYEWEVVSIETGTARAPASSANKARSINVEKEFLALKTEDLIGSGDYQQNRIKAGGKIPLKWKPYASAKSYKVLISNSASMKKITAELESPKPTVDVDALQALKGGMYYRVIASLDNGFTATSKVEQLVLRLPAPAPVVPPDDSKFKLASIPAGGILITWSKTGDVEGYTLEVARDATFKNVTVTKNSVENFVLLKGLPAGSYFWRVSGLAKTVRSAYSKPQRISIIQ